ncbi:hypothetical protein DFQ28_008036 [Apophysomyces sp. BC1034]|nr:hypothetical protein DFQ29_009584 [Apophysomyces sp. BC1021]KAG0186321.1 hypothetical protein DFQ28_008036 [Apophysomyces sp. BC1034]
MDWLPRRWLRWRQWRHPNQERIVSFQSSVIQQPDNRRPSYVLNTVRRVIWYPITLVLTRVWGVVSFGYSYQTSKINAFYYLMTYVAPPPKAGNVSGIGLLLILLTDPALHNAIQEYIDGPQTKPLTEAHRDRHPRRIDSLSFVNFRSTQNSTHSTVYEPAIPLDYSCEDPQQVDSCVTPILSAHTASGRMSAVPSLHHVDQFLSTDSCDSPDLRDTSDL